MISGLSDVSLSPKTNIIDLCRPQDTSNNPRTKSFSKNALFGNLRILEIEHVDLLEKAADRKSWRSVWYILENFECEISIYEKQEMKTWWYGINIFPKIWNRNLVISINWTWKIELLFYFQLKELEHLSFIFIFNSGNPATPTNSDSHTCTSPPLGGTRV